MTEKLQHPLEYKGYNPFVGKTEKLTTIQNIYFLNRTALGTLFIKVINKKYIKVYKVYKSN